MTPAAPAGKTKVAILGGGPAGLAAAFSLTSTPEQRAKYDVTLYQQGWRVGGKCGHRESADDGQKHGKCAGSNVHE